MEPCPHTHAGGIIRPGTLSQKAIIQCLRSPERKPEQLQMPAQTERVVCTCPGSQPAAIGAVTVRAHRSSGGGSCGGVGRCVGCRRACAGLRSRGGGLGQGICNLDLEALGLHRCHRAHYNQPWLDHPLAMQAEIIIGSCWGLRLQLRLRSHCCWLPGPPPCKLKPYIKG